LKIGNINGNTKFSHIKVKPFKLHKKADAPAHLVDSALLSNIISIATTIQRETAVITIMPHPFLQRNPLKRIITIFSILCNIYDVKIGLSSKSPSYLLPQVFYRCSDNDPAR